MPANGGAVPDWDARISDNDPPEGAWCELCGEWVSETDASEIDGDWLCPPCAAGVEEA